MQEKSIELKRLADYLRRTSLPVCEREASERIYNVSLMLEKVAHDLEEEVSEDAGKNQ